MAGKAKKGKAVDVAAIEKLSEDQLLDSISEYTVGGIKKASELANVERIPFGHLELDEFFGGGVPRGRIIEAFGNEGSGKTALALAMVAAVQRGGGRAAWVDAENTYDTYWAAINGIDNDQLLIAVPTSGDKGYELVKKLIASNKFDLVVVDSVAMMVPEAELMGEAGDANIGIQARLNGSAMKQLSNIMAARPRVSLVLINQVRSKVGGMGHGPQDTTTGGRAIPFFCTVRVGLRRFEYLKTGDQVTGVTIKATAKKAKITGMRDRAETTFTLDFEHGLDYAQSILNYGLDNDLVRKSGAWFESKVEGLEFKAQGEAAAKKQIRANLEQWNKVLADRTANH